MSKIKNYKSSNLLILKINSITSRVNKRVLNFFQSVFCPKLDTLSIGLSSKTQSFRFYKTTIMKILPFLTSSLILANFDFADNEDDCNLITGEKKEDEKNLNNNLKALFYGCKHLDSVSFISCKIKTENLKLKEADYRIQKMAFRRCGTVHNSNWVEYPERLNDL